MDKQEFYPSEALLYTSLLPPHRSLCSFLSSCLLFTTLTSSTSFFFLHFSFLLLHLPILSLLPHTPLLYTFLFSTPHHSTPVSSSSSSLPAWRQCWTVPGRWVPASAAEPPLGCVHEVWGPECGHGCRHPDWPGAPAGCGSPPLAPALVTSRWGCRTI